MNEAGIQSPPVLKNFLEARRLLSELDVAPRRSSTPVELGARLAREVIATGIVPDLRAMVRADVDGAYDGAAYLAAQEALEQSARVPARA